jgi:hypothetical protein
MALSTCSMASVVTASFLSFQLLQAHFIVFQVTVSVVQVLFSFIWWCCSDAT